MADSMTFPDTVEEFMEQYKVVDTEQVYTNGTEFVPIYRMKQWFEHLSSVQPYTDEQIQKAQEMEQAQLDKAFELGREDAKPQWIPVTERLPEPRTDVWVNSDIGQIQGYYEESVETWYASFGQGRDYLELIVNAWMPLPEPYQEGGE